MKRSYYTLLGVVAAILMMVVSLVAFYAMNQPHNGGYQMVVMGIYCLAVAYAIWHFHESHKNQALGFKDYFQAGFKTFIAATLLMVAFAFVFYKMNPQILENAIAENDKLIVAEQNRTAAEIKQNEQKLRNIFMPMMISFTTFKFIILGALIALIGSGFYVGSNKK